METSIFIARLAGPILALVGLGILTGPKAFSDVLMSFIESPATLYLTGFLALLGSVALLLVHNLWVFDWRVIITLLGWIGVAKGALIIVQPRAIVTLAKFFIVLRMAFVATAALSLALGLILSYFGYWA